MIIFTSLPGTADSMLGRFLPGLLMDSGDAPLTYVQCDAGCFAIFNSFERSEAGTLAIRSGFTGPTKHVDFEIPAWGEFSSPPLNQPE